ncbi:UDP-N-acetylglucosamine 2-epimerase (non-hydrolysing) [Microbacterium sp. AG790]|nr:UDP-N-acetylglucosamine 2-epimerase (non-hydrolysing) [Microbacterium sp. AG790]
MKLMPIYGTRPEAIKLAPVITEASRRGLELSIVTTGQHREMCAEVNGIFGIVPDHDLDIMKPSQTLAEISSETLRKLAPVLLEERPDAVLVQGDTSSATAAALGAYYQRIPVVHVEAGLRTFNLYSPFPEEGNRRVISAIASLHLAPTHLSRSNLVNEGITREAVVVTGNTVIDALEWASEQRVEMTDPRLEDLLRSFRPFILATVHRRESFGRPMREIGTAIRILAKRFPHIKFVIPSHPNPSVAEYFISELRGIPNVLITQPFSYLEMAQVLRAAHIVMTDSGGLQEEAPTFGKPVLVLRESSERPEAILAGTSKLVGTDVATIVFECELLITDQGAYESMARAASPFGDGRAARRSVSAIQALLGEGTHEPEFDPQSHGQIS